MKNLKKWNEEDTKNLYKCMWVKDFDTNNLPRFKNKFQRIKYFDELYRKLLETLPSEEKENLKRQLKNTNFILKRDELERIVLNAIRGIKLSFISHDAQKKFLLDDSSKINYKEMSYQQYRNQQIINPNNANKKYIPQLNVLKTLAPMEIINYIGFRMIKFDKFRGYFSVIIGFPKEMNKLPIIFYDENALIAEKKAEEFFENETENYLKNKLNPYGDKNYKEIDISNIEKVLIGNDNDPLEKDIF